MKRFTLAALFSFLGIVVLHSGEAKQSLRPELAREQHLLGYSLVDWWAGKVYVVSVKERTAKLAIVRNAQKVDSAECSSPKGRYSVFHKNGLWLRNNESGEALQIEAGGQFSTQCFSPEGSFVYSSGKMMRIYDLAKKNRMDLGEGGPYPTWSPDGKWLGFDDGNRYTLLDLKTGTRRKLFSTKNSAGPDWSPDSRYLTYTKPGGSMGGFLFWGIKCIEPYRVWVWRVEDNAHDWVQQICKPGRGFMWVRNSDLLFEQPTEEKQLNALTPPTGWRKVDAGPFSILAPPGWEFHQLTGVDSYVGEFVGDGVVLTFDFGRYSNPLKEEKKPAYVVIHKPVGGRRAKIVSPRTPGHGITGVYFRNVGMSNAALTLFGHDLTSTQQESVLKIFDTLQFGGPLPRYILPPPPPPHTKNVE